MMRITCLLLLLATVAHAEPRNEIMVGSFTRALRSDSANALTGDSLGGPAFGYARRLPLQLVPELELWGTATMVFGFADGTMFQVLSTELDTGQIAAGVRARYPLWRRFVIANARLEAGAQRASVTLRDANDHTASDSGWGASSTAAVGLELQPLSLRRFALGFRIELGFVATTGVGLTARSEGAPEDTLELDRMASALGHLDASGRYLSFTITSQF